MAGMENAQIEVRGVKGGVLITIPDGKWYQQRDALISRIQTHESFFKGGRIAIDVGAAEWNETQLIRLLKDFSDEGVCLWAVLSTSKETLAAARSFGIPTRITGDAAESAAPEKSEASSAPKTYWINRDLDEGESLVVEGNLVLLGDIPATAEVKATGSVVVWGVVSGAVFAGCSGCEDAALYIAKQVSGRLFLAGEQVILTRKQKESVPLSVRRIDGHNQVETSGIRKFKLL